MSSPVTPQRIPRSSVSTPYTPLSLHSFTSTSSTLTTPSSIQSARARSKHLNFTSSNASIVSENGVGNKKKTHKSCLSDIADSWRSRANEHGIKVSASQSTVGEDSHYGDDEASDRAFSDVNDTSFVTTEEVLLPPAFLSTHRRPRSQSQVLPPTSRSFAGGPLQPTSPNVLRTPARSTRPSNLIPSPASKATFAHPGAFIGREAENTGNHNHAKSNTRTTSSQNIENVIMCTPPPNKARAQNLRMKGSLTDPAALRRRPGVDSTPIRSKHDLSTKSLFDIDENDFEDDDASYEPSFNQYEYEQSFDYDYGFTDSMADAEINHLAIYETNKLRSEIEPFTYSPLTDRLNVATNFAQMLGMNVTPSYGLSTFASVPSFTQYPSPLPMQNMPLPIAQQHSVPSLYQLPTFSPHFLQPGQAIEHSVVPNDFGRSLMNSEDHFHTQQRRRNIPILPSIESPSSHSTESSGESSAGSPTKCSVCHRSGGASNTDRSRLSGSTPSLSAAPLSLAILSPCTHPLCSACLTSALNIVGEKDMECAVCKKAVSSFKLVNIATEFNSSPPIASPSASPLCSVDVNRLPPPSSTPKKVQKTEYTRGHSFLDPLFSSPGSVESAVNGLGFTFGNADHAPDSAPFEDFRASTPKEDHSRIKAQNGGRSDGKNKHEPVVLRIDNVPWDITPPAICVWLEQPVLRVHVLLDRKGKTLSHAFVEVENEDVARAVLRGEGKSRSGITRSGASMMRSSVLGKGRRARGVTVTRSSQEELMRSLFPSWRGSFDGCRPSLYGLDDDRVIRTLESGLMTETEITALLSLVQTPDSHFLKVPSLPFHSLISILSKFPTDVDSRVFWSSVLRDLLYDLTIAALRVLLSRSNGQRKETDACSTLYKQVYEAALGCHAFTAQQTANFEQVWSGAQDQPSSCDTENILIPTMPGLPECIPAVKDQSRPTSPPDELQHLTTVTQAPKAVDASPVVEISPEDKPTTRNLQDLAREFGVNPRLVEALAQRLNNQ
ncbi:hypothetical protein BDN71DRAFT_1424417 [Pleurotus eryngii]|uniref:RING-type domain-containing protein n=1 Tax=Pleurotus eryngii TaxID=5323 RepID=A0A9P5ZID2_PLEER|nr:hypothetical protein BDN71DRAFT_1424417 [Pleurotus eryngii]